MKKVTLLLLAILVMPCMADEINRETQSYRFYEKQLRSNLAHSYDAIKDRDGYYWFGTLRGLKRYDGRTTQLIYSDAGQVFENEPIMRLVEVNGELWLGGAKGLFRLRLDDYRVIDYSQKSKLNASLPKGYIAYLSKGFGNDVWVSSLQGLFHYQAREDRFEPFTLPQVTTEQAEDNLINAFRRVAPINEDYMLCATFRRGLQVLDTRSGQFKAIGHYLDDISPAHKAALSGSNVMDAYRSRENTFIVLAEHFFFEFDSQFNIINTIDFSKIDTDGSVPQVLSVKQAPNGDLWVINLNNGIQRISADRATVSSISQHKTIENSFELGSFNGLFVEKNGDLLLSRNNNAPLFWNSLEDRVKVIPIGDKNSINKLKKHSIVYSLPTKGGGAWLTTTEHAVIKVDPNLNFEFSFQLPKPIYSINNDNTGNLWLGTAGGVYRYDTIEQKLHFAHALHGVNQIDHSSVTGTWFLAQSKLYRLPAVGADLISYNIDSDENLLDATILVDNKGDLLLRGGSYLYRYSHEQDEIVKISSPELLLRGKYRMIIVDGRLFFIGNGLVSGELNPETGLLELVDAKQFAQFNHESFFDVSVADQGFWMVARGGARVYYYDKNTLSISKQFDLESGFPWRHSTHLMSSNNEKLVFFSDGFLLKMSYPSSKFVMTPKSILHQVKISNEDQKQRIIYGKVSKLVLTPEDYAVSFLFGDTLSHSDQGVKSEYRMIGVSDNWISDSNNHATFAGLSPGNYRFEIRGLVHKNVQQFVDIEVMRPWWLTWWAYLLYSSAVLVICATIFYLRWSKNSAQRLANEQIELYAQGFEKVDQGICIFDESANFVSGNRAFEKFIALPEDTSNFTLESILLKDSYLDSFPNMWKWLLLHGFWQGRLLLQGPKGNQIPAECRASKVRHDSKSKPVYMLLLSDISERLRHEKELEQMANIDSLTGLPNRFYLKHYLQTKIDLVKNQQIPGFSIIFLDIDRFKSINDSLSHYIGDLLLQELANRFSACFGDDTFVARLGGDEFVVVTPAILHNDSTLVARKLLDQVESPFLLDHKKLRITLSLGLAMCTESETDLDLLLRNADLAMYSVKAQGGNGYGFYTEEMNESTVSALKLELDLHKAFEDDEFVVYYQPKVNMKTGALTGFEALIRWNHQQDGIILPEGFIGAAEKTGIIVKIGMKVVHTVCSQLHQWREQGFDLYPIAINISPQQLLQPNFVSEVISIVRHYRIDNYLIEFEITESMLMEDMDTCIQRLQALRNRGHLISIDDFGTGYSSLSYLKKLPIDAIKIDQSFIVDMLTDADQQHIVRAIIELSARLKLTLVAEGVESVQLHKLLVEFGCEQGQGFFYAKPFKSDQGELFHILNQGGIFDQDISVFNG